MPDSPEKIKYNLDYMPKLRKRLVDCKKCTGTGLFKNSGVGMIKKETIMCVTCNGLGSLLDGDVVLDDELIKLYRSFQIQAARTYVSSIKNSHNSLITAALVSPARVNEWIKNNKSKRDGGRPDSGPDNRKNTRGPFGATLTLD